MKKKKTGEKGSVQSRFLGLKSVDLLPSPESSSEVWAHDYKAHDLLMRASEALSIGSWEVRLDRQEIFWSPMTRRIHEVEALFQPTLESGLAFYESGESQDRICVLFQRAVEQLEPYDDQFTIITAHGNRRWVRSIGIPEVVDGQCVGVYGVFQDITKEKQRDIELDNSRYEVENFFDLSRNYLSIANVNGYFERLNRAFIAALGYPLEVLLETPFIDLVHPDDVEATLQEVSKLSQGESAVQFSNRFLTQTGEYIHLLWNSSPNLATGQIYATAVDISATAYVDSLKHEFVSTVSHELRTPLTAIVGSLKLIESGSLAELDASIKPLVNMALSNAERLVLLINDLLDFERLESGQLSLSFDVYRAVTLIEQALEENRLLCTTGNHALELVIESDARELCIIVDPLRFKQILTNVLSNAIKFSPTGTSVEVCVSVVCDQLEVRVTDHGPGIPKHYYSRIFQRFSQLDSSDKRGKGGAGLGLAISHELVERMSGTIGFESTEGQGTAFFVRFPYVIQSDEM